MLVFREKKMYQTYVRYVLIKNALIFREKVSLVAVEDKIFTPHSFISLATRTTSPLSWILEKSTLKPKIAHIYTK